MSHSLDTNIKYAIDCHGTTYTFPKLRGRYLKQQIFNLQENPSNLKVKQNLFKGLKLLNCREKADLQSKIPRNFLSTKQKPKIKYWKKRILHKKCVSNLQLSSQLSEYEKLLIKPLNISTKNTLRNSQEIQNGAINIHLRQFMQHNYNHSHIQHHCELKNSFYNKRQQKLITKYKIHRQKINPLLRKQTHFEQKMPKQKQQNSFIDRWQDNEQKIQQNGDKINQKLFQTSGYWQ